MLMIVFLANEPGGKINSTLPSSEAICPPSAPISLLISFPSGVPKPVESDSLAICIFTESDWACATIDTRNIHRNKNIFILAQLNVDYFLIILFFKPHFIYFKAEALFNSIGFVKKIFRCNQQNRNQSACGFGISHKASAIDQGAELMK